MPQNPDRPPPTGGERLRHTVSGARSRWTAWVRRHAVFIALVNSVTGVALVLGRPDIAVVALLATYSGYVAGSLPRR